MGKQLCQSDLLTDTPVDVVNLHLLVATLSVRIAGGEMKLFGRTLSLIVKSHGAEVMSLRAMPTGRVVLTQALSIPTTENYLRKYFVGKIPQLTICLVGPFMKLKKALLLHCFLKF